jgi:Plasmid replication region DNA-binding N-term
VHNPSSSPGYGTTRNRRPSVSYAAFERAADALLAAGEKPGLENVRQAIGGSPETIRQMLKRYWADLAALKRSPAEALMRLPSEIADLADELWQRSLSLAAQSATHDDNAARERLEQVKRENEVRSHSLTVKERTLREREESRDKSMKELQEQVATLLSIVGRNTETIAALQAAKLEAERTTENYRERLSQVITRAVVRNQTATIRKPSRPKKKPKNPRKLKRPARAQHRVAKRPKKRSRR